jgi:hypothetical protein
MFVTQPQQAPEPSSLVDASEESDRPSITEVNGTIAKFEMAYSPDKADRFAFGPPLWTRLPGYAFVAFAACIALTVFAAYHGSSNSRLYIWVVEGDRNRVIGSAPLAFIIAFTAIGNMIKTSLRGVIVTAEGIEARMIHATGFPSVKRWTWAQIDRVVLDDGDVMLELWNGTYERLPRVREGKKLADLLASIATARGRGVTRLAPELAR